MTSNMEKEYCTINVEIYLRVYSRKESKFKGLYNTIMESSKRFQDNEFDKSIFLFQITLL